MYLQARFAESFLPRIRITDLQLRQGGLSHNNFEPENLVMEIGFCGGEHLALRPRQIQMLGLSGASHISTALPSSLITSSNMTY